MTIHEHLIQARASISNALSLVNYIAQFEYHKSDEAKLRQYLYDAEAHIKQVIQDRLKEQQRYQHDTRHTY